MFLAGDRGGSGDWHRLAVEQAAVGILQLGPDGAIREANPGLCRMLGATAAELIGQSLAARMHPDDVPAWRDQLGRGARGELDAFALELRVQREHRVPVWLELDVTVVRDEAGRMRFGVGVAQDVSARHDAERALRRRVAKFFAAFDGAKAPMTQVEPKSGRFERTNRPFCELTGYTENELLGLTLEDITHPEDRGRDADLSAGFTPERRYLRKDGGVFWAIRYATPMYHDSGELFRTLSAWVDVGARRQTEDALRLSEARFRSLAEAGPFMVYSSDADGFPSYLSPALVAYLGLDVGAVRDDLVLASLVHPDDAAIVAELRAPSTHVTSGEVRLRRADGAFRWFLARAVGLDDDAGRFVQRIGSLTDIHDRKQAELALAASEERFRIASEAVDGLIYDYDPSTSRVYRSPGLTATLGWSPDELPPTVQAWQDLVHPDDRAEAIERGAAAIEAGLSSFAVEYRVRHKAGHWVDLWDNQRILRDESGKAVRVVGHSIDVTARRRAEEALRASEARLAGLANASPALFWSTTVDGTNSWASEAWLRYTGRPVAEPGGWTEVLHPLDRERTVATWQEALAKESDFTIENRIRRYDGEYRWFLTRAVPLRDEDGAPTGWMGATTDIHDLKLAEAALREDDRRKDEFLATLAHELRNPLAPIRNAVEVLRMEPAESPHLAWARDMIDRQVDQLTRLVDDLLEVSRITRGLLSLRMETVEVAQLFRDVLEAVRPTLAQQGLDVDDSLPRETLRLRADPVRLAQVLVNLLDNAAKHSGTTSHIRLSAARDGGRIRLSVEDDGRGMTADETLRVFQLFYRAGDAVEHRPGLGVGLALVKSLIELHGGSVEAYSAGPGRGSRFSVHLPALEAEAVQAAPARESEPPPAAGLRVLVADDNRDSTESLAALLEMWGHQVETASDGIEACEVGERFRPEVALLDLRMPRLDGYGAARRIRRAPWGAGILLVAQTGWGQESDRRLAEQAGFDFHLTKPVNFAALRKILAEARGGGPRRPV